MVINELAAAEPLTPRVDVARRRRVWATPVRGSQILAVLARDAIELFTRKAASRIRECAGTTSQRLKQVSGDPNRTSFELQLNTNAERWLVGARLADA